MDNWISMRQHFNPLKLEFRIYIYYNDLITLWILWTNNLFSQKIEFKKKKNSGVHYFASSLKSFFLSLISQKISNSLARNIYQLPFPFNYFASSLERFFFSYHSLLLSASKASSKRASPLGSTWDKSSKPSAPTKHISWLSYKKRLFSIDDAVKL